MVNEVIYNLFEITDGICNRNTPRVMKMEILQEMVNFDRWSFVGFESNGSKVRLMPKFHNIRDSKGRFKSLKKTTKNSNKKTNKMN
jgi:hypothetical protein